MWAGASTVFWRDGGRSRFRPLLWVGLCSAGKEWGGSPCHGQTAAPLLLGDSLSTQCPPQQCAHAARSMAAVSSSPGLGRDVPFPLDSRLPAAHPLLLSPACVCMASVRRCCLHPGPARVCAPQGEGVALPATAGALPATVSSRALTTSRAEQR